MYLRMIMAIALSCICGCEDANQEAAPTIPDRTATTIDLTADTIDIYESALRKNGCGAPDGNPHFVRVANGDPPPELLQRFAGRTPPVERRSAFIPSANRKNRQAEQDGNEHDNRNEGSSQHPRFYRVEILKWIDKDTVEVKSDCIFGPTGGWGSISIISRKNGAWFTVKVKSEWDS